MKEKLTKATLNGTACWVLLPIVCFLFFGPRLPAYSALTAAQIEKLKEYAQATVRYFTSAQANNLEVGFTHTFFGTGKFQVYKDGQWQEEAWDLTRGYGSHVNINEVTLRFLCLAAAYKMGWLDFLPPENRYAASWGQILIGLQTLRYLQTSGNPRQYKDGHFHRNYLTTITRDGQYDLDRHVEEIVCPEGEDIQSSDDNALPFMNLLVLEGLANDVTVDIPDRAEIIALCRAIRDAIDLRGFVVGNTLAHAIENGSPSTANWDRLSAEGAIILAALLLSDQITQHEFELIYPSLRNYPVDWNTLSGGVIPIGKPSYHAAMFIHGLRAIHGMPVTEQEWAGLDYFRTSTKPVFEAHMDYDRYYGYGALGTQVMSQTLYGTPLFEMNGRQVRFPGNEDNLMPVPGVSLSRATGPHAWFIVLQRALYLDQGDIDELFTWMASYESEFFHSGSDVELGWEAAIPWRPDDRTYAWQASDGTWKYTDWGRPFEALNSAYIVLSIFDALNPDAPLASYNVEAQRLKHIAFYLDNGRWPTPSAPTNVHATDGTYIDQIQVTWDAVLGATRYEIYRATVACGTYTKVGESETTSYDDTDMTLLRAYWYKVKACNASGCSDLSSADSGYAGVPGAGTGAIFRIERGSGNVRTDGIYYGQCYYAGYADIAEWVPVSEEVEPGDVLEIDPENPGYYCKARGPCSTLVAGVVSTEPGFVLGHGGDTEGKALLALMGIVPVKVTDEGGPIRPGDLLVVSSTPGYAMRWDPESGEICGLVGKALEPWEEGEGMILVILMR